MITVNPWLWLIGVTIWGVIVGTVWAPILMVILHRLGYRWR